jgi:hypothetical protein
MPDKLMRAQITIPLDSGVPDDVIVNTLYFDGDEDLDQAATDDDYHQTAFTAITNFLHAIDNLILPVSVGPVATVKLYDMRDPEPRVPEFEDLVSLTPTASPPLPNEVAVCLSFQAVQQSGQLQRRRRGRIFLGPVANDANVVAVINGQARPKVEMRDAICSAASSMKQTDLPIGIGGSVRWAIYSKTTDLGGGSPPTAGTSIDDAFHDVDNGWIDDTFDTQRRRGPAATARATFT